MYRAGLTAQGCWDEMDAYDKQAIEKFAELIIQECTEVTADWYKNHNQYHMPPDEHIKAHFGVENE